MKRFTWLLIAIVCTALVQVRAVELPVKESGCCCCEGDAGNACGMVDCAPAPTGCSYLPTVSVAAGQHVGIRKLSPAPRVQLRHFYARFESRPALKPAVRASLAGASAVSVPLFKAHCSYLI